MIKFNSNTYALPLDIFRLAVGFLSIIYFARAIFDAPYFFEQAGLINHELVLDIFWYTWQPLFHPSMPDVLIYLIFILGIILSLCLTIGIKSKLVAFLLYSIVVCMYRYQFLVFFVDDVVMHLLLFWCFILPTGNTLILSDWIRNKEIINKWKSIKVDGFTTKILLINIALIYFVAGVSKYTSPLWLNGIALFATLKLPLAWFAQYPLENFSTIFQVGNYLALVFEPLFVLLVVLKPWNKIKLFLGTSFFLFHLTIMLTLDISTANIGCIILTPIVFRHEIMDLIGKSKQTTQDIIIPTRFTNNLAIFMIIFLIGAMSCALIQDQWRTAKRSSGKEPTAQTNISSADSGGKIQTFFYGGLWIIGLAQGYRLLDWIDERNYYQKVTIHEEENYKKKRYERKSLVPNGMRGSLIMSYISEVTWMYVNPERVEELREDIRKRMKAMYCRNKKPDTKVKVWHEIGRVNSFDFKPDAPEVLMNFKCVNSAPHFVSK